MRPTSQPLRQEARRNTTTKRNELRSTSAPAQSADRHTSTKRIKIYLCGGRTEAKVRMYLSSLRGCTRHARKRDQDLNATVVETGKKRGTVHLSSLRTDTHVQSYFCTLVKHEGLKQASGREHHETELISLNKKKGGGRGGYLGHTSCSMLKKM